MNPIEPHAPSPTRINEIVAEARPACFWLDREFRPAERPPLAGSERADLAIVGGGYTGLWAALIAKERDPAREVVLLESDRIGEGASGRNGGFASPSLTHGVQNGLSHFGETELRTLVDLGEKNWQEYREALVRHGIACDLEETGSLHAATEAWWTPEIDDLHQTNQRFGVSCDRLSAEETQSSIHSPTFLGSAWDRTGGVLDPGKLVFGLSVAAERLGVRIFENTRVTALHREKDAVRLDTTDGTLRADRVVLATNAFKSPLPRMRRSVVPVWDYALVTAPLTKEQLDKIGWADRQGLADTANQFHYARLTADDRILWGGFDAIYRFGSGTGHENSQREESFRTLARHFFETFPQLEDIEFSHKWGGPIATTSRFCLDHGSAWGGRVAWTIGYTGLGVVCSRFGAQAALDRMDQPDAAYLGLKMLKKRAFPWPPEPFRWAAIRMTQRALAKADANRGKRGPWLRLLDALGLGFDS